MRDAGDGVSEDAQLPCVHCAVFIRASQVRHQHADFQLTNYRVIDLMRRQAKPVDAAIDHQVAGAASTFDP